MELVVAEKPSVAMDIGKVIGATKKEDGFVSGNGYIVTWCLGHLVELAMPSAYDEAYKKWSVDTLPIAPGKWIYGIKKATKEQYAKLKELFKRPDISSVICATDAGREGELIFRNAYNKAGCTKPIKRLWISSMEDSAVKAGFENLKNGDDYISLYEAAQARERADWLTGMNLSRLYTLVYGGGDKISIGRVMTPTLAMICERDTKVEGFVKEKYYTVHLGDGKGIDAVSEKLFDAEEAEKLKKFVDGKQARVSEVTEENKKIQPPLLYDLTSLQRDCNRIFGFSANKTLEIAQELYEKKLTTYPRTDAKVLTDDMEDTALKAFAACCLRFDFAAGKTPVNVKRILNSKKVSDHHAIIPTGNNEGIDKLANDVRLVYDIISIRVIAALSEAYEYKSMSADIICEDVHFLMTGTCCTKQGFKEIEQAFKKKNGGCGEEQKEKELPDIKQYYTFAVQADVKEDYTKPPSYYTEDSLLSAMESAGKKEMASEVERKGLGTSATRAGTIEKLIDNGYVIREGKKLISTEAGRYIIKVIPERVKSVELTCDWENELLEVSKGKVSYDAFMGNILNFIKGLVDEGKTVKPVPRKSIEKNVLAECPYCKSNLISGKFGAYCEGKCGIFLTGPAGKLTDEQVVKLFAEQKEVLLKNLTSQKGSKYDAYIKYDTTEKFTYQDKEGTQREGIRIKYSMRFPENKKNKKKKG